MIVSKQRILIVSDIPIGLRFSRKSKVFEPMGISERVSATSQQIVLVKKNSEGGAFSRKEKPRYFQHYSLFLKKANRFFYSWWVYLTLVALTRHDSPLLKRSRQILENLSTRTIEQLTAGRVQAAVTDRGFDSKENVAMLKARHIYNGIAPKNPAELRRLSTKRTFRQLQKRRGSTEGRIAIFKNVFCGQPLRVKGFARREIAITWRVLAHNLWVLARLPQAEKQEQLARAAWITF